MEITPRKELKIVAILGSAQQSSMTSEVFKFVQNEIEKHSEIKLEIIDPTDLDLRVPGKGSTNDAREIERLVREADGVILATPEYHGSYSSTIKLVIDNLGFPSALSGKPVSLLGVAAGQIGAIKALEHLRSVASHVGGLVLAGPVSVAGVRSAFDENGAFKDVRVEKMVRSVATSLLDYLDSFVCPKMALEEMARQAAA